MFLLSFSCFFYEPHKSPFLFSIPHRPKSNSFDELKSLTHCPELKTISLTLTPPQIENNLSYPHTAPNWKRSLLPLHRPEKVTRTTLLIHSHATVATHSHVIAARPRLCCHHREFCTWGNEMIILPDWDFDWLGNASLILAFNYFIMIWFACMSLLYSRQLLFG